MPTEPKPSTGAVPFRPTRPTISPWSGRWKDVELGALLDEGAEHFNSLGPAKLFIHDRDPGPAGHDCSCGHCGKIAKLIATGSTLVLDRLIETEGQKVPAEVVSTYRHATTAWLYRGHTAGPLYWIVGGKRNHRIFHLSGSGSGSGSSSSDRKLAQYWDDSLVHMMAQESEYCRIVDAVADRVRAGGADCACAGALMAERNKRWAEAEAGWVEAHKKKKGFRGRMRRMFH